MRITVGADDEGAVADTVVDALRARGHDVTVLEREQWPELARKLRRVSYEAVRREHNELADRLVNEALDSPE